MTHGPACPLDPRVERSRRVILEATIELLAETGYGGLTIEAVAARAGVGKSTVYRHWQGRLDLVEAAFETLREPLELPFDGDVRTRVTELLTRVAATLAEPPWSEVLAVLIEAAQRDAELATFHRRFGDERRKVLVDLLDEGVARGELAGEVDTGMLGDALTGPIFMRRLMRQSAFAPHEVAGLVDTVWPTRHKGSCRR